jgi:Helicase associated domain
MKQQAKQQIIIDKEWDRLYNKLCEFYALHGHTNVPKVYPNCPELPEWVAQLRQSYSLLNEGIVDQLRCLGFCWEDEDKNTNKSSKEEKNDSP